MRTLVSTVRSGQVTPFHVALLQFIDAADFSGVRRKVAEELRERNISPIEEYLDEGILALKQYYAIAILDPRNKHAVSAAVDPFWHAHILHTKEYVDFCERLVGGYIHHTPLNHQRHDEVELVGQLYRYTSTCYRQFFSYVNLSFFPTDLPRHRLVCLHQQVRSEEVLLHGLLPTVPITQTAFTQ